MPSMEQVEKLRAYADISVEEARDVLTEAGEDLLEAVILLERRGRIKPPPAPEGSARRAPADDTPPEAARSQPGGGQTQPPPGETFSQLTGRFFRFVGRMIHRGNINTVEVMRRGEHIMSLPVTLLVILLLFCFWWVVPLAFIGLFFDYRYYFRGPDMGREPVNRVMDTAADTAQRFKNEAKKSAEAYDEQHREGDDSDR